MIANRIRQMYEITPENVALDMDRVTAAYERLDTLLENCRYLVGDQFSRADLRSRRWQRQRGDHPSTRRIGHRMSSIRTNQSFLGSFRKDPYPRTHPAYVSRAPPTEALPRGASAGTAAA